MYAMTTKRTTAPRIAAFALVLVAAAILGLAVGSVLNSWTHEQSRTATAVFSADALSAVQAARGDTGAGAAAAVSAAESDYGLRHGAGAEARAAANAESDHGLRHRPAAPKAQRVSTTPQPE